MAVFSRIKTWVSNEVLTAADLNTEFNNIINNMDPEGIEDASASVSDMQSVTNPGGVGSESQATDLLGELKRLRYKIKEILGTAQWYSAAPRSLTTLSIVEADIASNAVTNAKLADNAVNTAEITNSAVTADKLATDAVETAKIKDLNVTTGKLANGAVTPAKRSTALYGQVTGVSSINTSATHAISFTGTGRPVKIALVPMYVSTWTCGSNTELKLYKNGSAVLTFGYDGDGDSSLVSNGFTYIDTSGYSGSVSYDLRSTVATSTLSTGTFNFTVFEL